MPGVINIRVTLDSNVFISAIKENEEYSKDCRELLNLYHARDALSEILK